MMDSGLLNLNDDIKEALNTNKPLVALESTLISHGLPYPQNFEVAPFLEHIKENDGGY